MMATSPSGSAAWSWPHLAAPSFVETQRSMTHKDPEGDVKLHMEKMRFVRQPKQR